MGKDGKGKEFDEVKLATLLAKNHGLDKAKVAQLMMKNGLDKSGIQKTVDDCAELARQGMIKTLKGAGLPI